MVDNKDSTPKPCSAPDDDTSTFILRTCVCARVLAGYKKVAAAAASCLQFIDGRKEMNNSSFSQLSISDVVHLH